MNRMLLLLFCIGLAGCATPTNKYAGAYNEAVSDGHSVVIFKEGDFETVEDTVYQQVSSFGYGKVLYSSPKDGFMVLVKDVDFGSPLISSDKHSYQIILKYTNISEGKTRIDLVNGSTESFTKDAIDRDIQKLATMIRSS